MSAAQHWILAARPKTLPAGATPVVLSAALAWERGLFHGPSMLCALMGALLIQVGTNFANDYFDFIKGTDTEERVGPTRATQAGLVQPRTMLIATILIFLLTFLPGGYLIYRGGWPILVIGLVSIACGVLYTGGPFPLGYLGLGDLFVLIFFGPVAVGGAYYVQAGSVDALVLILGLAPGLFSTAILSINNLRDADGDARTGKRTLAVRFGKPFARFEYLACLLIASLVIPLYACLSTGGHWPALASALVLVAAAPAIRDVLRGLEGAPLNDTLAKTGKQLVIFTVLFCVGWLL
ncbi:MAG: 1,4-dihydroxy-2-naphthoate polyprenyltransferase [Candidatus Hydrogenedentes bacterium]|nr:1,4-dihydroxy-2-naphthoate polyprenyltransferase [Candidatus Hydrogenedentota bacterium]